MPFSIVRFRTNARTISAFSHFYDIISVLLTLELIMITDFAKILNELKEAGINDYKLAELTSIERSKLTKLRNGTKKQPNYDDGVAIMSEYNKINK